jgi:hypothetical protein
MAGLKHSEPCSALLLCCRQESKDELFVRRMRPCVRGAGMCVCVRVCVRRMRVSRVCVCVRVGRGETLVGHAGGDAGGDWLDPMRMDAHTTIRHTRMHASAPAPTNLLGTGRGKPVLACSTMI